LSKILIVEKFGDKLPGYIEILREQSQFGMEDPRVKFVFSTVHKFKGLEMDNVRLLDDFNYIGIPYESPYYNPVTGHWEVPGCMTEIDEFNLLYVALTRAKVKLILNDALYFLLSSNSVNYSFLHILPVVPAVVGECVKCKEKVEVGGPVTLYQDLVRVGDKCRMGGWLCGLCSWSDLRRVNHVLGGKNPGNGWKVNPGTIRDAYIRWVRCLVGPKRGLGDPVQLERHIDKLFERGTADNEVASWVEEDSLIEEFMFEDEDDRDLLDAVEEFENEFDEDDALLLAVAVP